MKKHLLLTSVIFLTGCNAHIGYNDLASVVRGNSYYAHSSVQQKASPEQCAIHATARAANSAESQLSRYQAQLTNAQEALSKNKAWQNGSCVRPAMRELPPRPKTLSENEIAFQAIGSCTDTAMRRAAATEVVQAFASVRREDYLKIGAAWNKGNKEQCAMQQMSQANDWFARAVCGVFGQEARWSCMQDAVDFCVQKITETCRAPLSVWEMQTTLIKKEPEALFEQCQSSLQQIGEAEREIPNAQITAKLNREEHNRIAASNSRPVPISACSF